MIQDAQQTPLRRDSMHPDPIKQFEIWFAEAERAVSALPNAMTLATADRSGKPAARMVLLKGVDTRGFVFYTSYAGRKAGELRDNPCAALVFYWPPLARQVRVEGAVEMVSPGESERYFAGRPRGHQLEAHASPQSSVVNNRSVLQQRFAEVAVQFDGQKVPRPASWGGYRVVPESIEFWQEGEHRLHDRLRYRRDTAGHWMIERLAP